MQETSSIVTPSRPKHHTPYQKVFSSHPIRLFMLKKSVRSLAFVLLSLALLAGCKGTEDEQINAARRFADHIATNHKPGRDSMVATFLFRDYFQNQYVEADFLNWFRSFYDWQKKQFRGSARVDTDRKFAKELAGAM